MHLEAILDGCSFILSAAICVLVGHTIFLIIELYQEQHHPSETCKRLNPLVMPERQLRHFATSRRLPVPALLFSSNTAWPVVPPSVLSQILDVGCMSVKLPGTSSEFSVYNAVHGQILIAF